MVDNHGDWHKDFTEFSNQESGHLRVPESAFARLKSRLFPNPWIVFGKVAAIHTVVGFLSLGICNQFGLNPFQTQQSLTIWFMKIAGHGLCMLLCGLFFMAATYLLANLFLNLEEIESIKRHEWLHAGVFGLASLAAFYFFGAELVGSFAALWIAGAVAGALGSIEGSYRLRRSLA